MGYVVNRIGRYQIIQGIGRFGGEWIAHRLGDTAIFSSRAAAEEYAEMASE